jgi:DNA-binding Xre family transcriptional regulator
MKIRLRVKEVAEEKGLNMTKLSQRSEIAFTTVKSIFRDPYRTLNTDTLRRLAEALEVSVHDLIEEVPDDRTD